MLSYFSGVCKETLSEIFEESKRVSMYQAHLHNKTSNDFSNELIANWTNLPAFRCVSANTIGDLFLSFIATKYKTFVEEMKAIKYKVVSFDHTFRSASNIVTVTNGVMKKQFKTLILIVNEAGLIGRFLFLKNESLADIAPVLKSIAEVSRPIMTFSDKCCDEWRIVKVYFIERDYLLCYLIQLFSVFQISLLLLTYNSKITFTIFDIFADAMHNNS